jgi:glutamine phosphoribosylpyrophosphate amidotransferase
MIHLLAEPSQRDAPDPLAATLRRLQGAFSVVFLFEDRLEAARDPWGWRPLVLGRLPNGCDCVASETVALDVMGAEFIREVEPGEIVTLDHHGVTSRPVRPARRSAWRSASSSTSTSRAPRRMSSGRTSCVSASGSARCSRAKPPPTRTS